VLARISARVQRLLERRGLDPGDGDGLQTDPAVEESRALTGISSASIQGRIAFGPRTGARVWRIGADPDAPWVLSTAPRRAHLAGFDLHANVDAPAADRPRLKQRTAIGTGSYFWFQMAGLRCRLEDAKEVALRGDSASLRSRHFSIDGPSGALRCPSAFQSLPSRMSC
jgi:hypothetical protein